MDNNGWKERIQTMWLTIEFSCFKQEFIVIMIAKIYKNRKFFRNLILMWPVWIALLGHQGNSRHVASCLDVLTQTVLVSNKTFKEFFPYWTYTGYYGRLGTSKAGLGPVEENYLKVESEASYKCLIYFL